VIHRTFRSLDAAPKLVGFTIKQWTALIAAASAVLGMVYVAHLPAKPAITLCVFVIGLPAALTYVSESGGLQLGVLLGDMWRWRWSTHTLGAASPESASARSLVVLAWTDEPADDSRGSGYDPSLDDLLSEERWG
jgi:hypothetical protein